MSPPCTHAQTDALVANIMLLVAERWAAHAQQIIIPRTVTVSVSTRVASNKYYTEQATPDRQ